MQGFYTRSHCMFTIIPSLGKKRPNKKFIIKNKQLNFVKPINFSHNSFYTDKNERNLQIIRQFNLNKSAKTQQNFFKPNVSFKQIKLGNIQPK